jgi:hydroxymethylpyrimidine/phosphomethylpyrimidine kinase
MAGAADHGAASGPPQRACQASSEFRSGPQPIALTIAGFDPSGGAGITADLKVFAAHELYGVAAATALTVQSTAGVRRVEPVPAALLAETLACLAADLAIDGLKIGMLATAANVEAVTEFLLNLTAARRAAVATSATLPIVLDPVLCSSSGHSLLESAGIDLLRRRLLPLVSCITPNVDELLLLAGHPRPADAALGEAVSEAAAALAYQFPGLKIVATGGHLSRPDDLVLEPGHTPVWQQGEWVDTPSTHGTGCGYSSALLCGLVRGQPLPDAALSAKRYVTEALQAATPIGHGGGSIDHLYRWRASQRPGKSS